MNRFVKFRKPIALFLLFVFLTQLAAPSVVWALTSGPAQPEMKAFSPAGTSDMVDLFSGDFSYNLPLLDVGGYPVNLSYHGGAGMDDEAGWVGLGWTLSPGVMNRQMRGLPDEFNGDVVTKEFNVKDDVTGGGNLEIYPEFFGLGKVLKLSVNIGLFKNSYRGWGAEVGANVGIKLTEMASGTGTTGTGGGTTGSTATGTGGGSAGGGSGPSVSLGINSNSQSGASIKPSVNLAISNQSKNLKEVNAGMSIGTSYNSRSGMQALTLSGNVSGTSYKEVADPRDQSKKHLETTASGGGSSSSTISFARQSYTPIINTPFNNQSYTFSASFGPAVFGVHIKGALSGYYMRQTVAQRTQSLKAYGLLNAQRGQQDLYALMDFNRENDIPYQDGVPYLPIPVSTPDLFTASSQKGSHQYKLYRNGSGVFFDHRGVNNSFSGSLGVEIGAGNIFQGGVDIYAQKVTTSAGKWQDQNDYLSKGQFTAADKSNPTMEPAYFKRVGEQMPVDEDYYATLNNEDPFRVDIRRGRDVRALNRVVTGSGNGIDLSQPWKRNRREARNHVFNTLSMEEAATYGLDRTLNSYPKNQLIIAGCDDNKITRYTRSKPGHHIGEITTTDDQGVRTVFGIPVYNQTQTEASFSVDPANGNKAGGLVKYRSGQDDTGGNNIGRDHYCNKQTMPPYAYAYLLTGILSPDYTDLTGNGISDDDPGTAVKFNYSKITDNFAWRTPYEKDSANFNEDLLSDPKDDKANYTYGQKEIWYLHSIESKTMVAMFYLKDREDGLGVLGSAGGKNTTVRQQYLDHIDLFTKADLLERKDKAVPVKTVHFEYDYSVCGNVPNNSGNAVMVNGVDINARKGKLTLKKVYFTFGTSRKGALQPYVFTYNDKVNGVAVDYGHKQADRWGTYKNGADNSGGLRNDEYPYTPQDKLKADENAGLWQISRIDLPTGGHISVNYEADDYAYVQNKRAMQMCTVAGLDNKGQSTGMIQANEVLINLPKPVNSQQELMYRYFQGMEKLYFKCLTDLDGKGHEEFIPGYGTIKKVRLVDENTAAVTLDKVEGVNPISKTAWQYLRLNLPMYAYPGSDTDDLDGDATQIIRALVAALGNVKELVENFDSRAERKAFANKINLNKSWVRLNAPTFAKLGGGSRVKGIRMSDNWQAMSGENMPEGSYGQDYGYTTTGTDEKGQPMTISSGVASYEPMIGNDENPFRQPFSYQSKPGFLGLNDYYYMEDPIGEAYFPAASVGYGKVTVRSVGADNYNNRTGYTETIFYTAKDFPVVVKKMDKDQQDYRPSPILNIFKVKVENSVGVSQGYSIELNDMHGRMKGEAVYNRGGSKISSAEYIYKTDNPLAAQQRVKNEALLLQPDGSLKQGRIGEEIEVFTDMREQRTENIGGSVHASGGAFMAWIFPVPYFYPGIGPNIETREFRSASTVKVIQKFGLLEKTRVMKDGSSVSTENLAWDSETGEVLLTRTYNEFDDPVYNLTYPAHWAYGGMGQAYRNIGLELSGVSTNASRQLQNIPAGLLYPGDEVLDAAHNMKGWISQPEGSGALYVMDAAGNTQSLSNATLKVTRSGKRNLAAISVGSVTSLRNPVKGGKIDLTAFSQVLNVSAVTYKDQWQVAQALPCGCPAGYVKSQDGMYCNKYDTVARSQPDSVKACPRGNSAYGFKGTFVYDSAGYSLNGTGTKTLIPWTNDFWRNVVGDDKDGRMNSCAVWDCEDDVPDNKWIGFKTTFNVPTTKLYYIGMAGDNTIRITVDGKVVMEMDPFAVGAQNGTGEGAAFYWWHVYPVLLSAGTHTIFLEGLNHSSVAGFGAEIYNNTRSQIFSATSYNDLNLIFSTRDMRDKYFQVGDAISGCPAGYFPADDGIHCIKLADQIPAWQPTAINPYVAGILGNWRPWQQFVWHDSRRQLPENAAEGVTNIRRSGIFTSFIPFWRYDNGMFRQVDSKAYPSWVMISDATKYNNKGEGLESRDALGRYRAALFGYLQTTPIAMASNAMNTDIGYDGFEDYSYSLACTAGTDTCNIEGHFDFRKLLLRNIKPVTEAAHTGRYSLKLSAPVVIKRDVTVLSDLSFLSYNSNGEAYTKPNATLRPFTPVPGKRYLASVWVKDPSLNSSATGVMDILSGDNVVVSSSAAGPQVEGWRKVEVVFTVPAGASDISVKLSPKSGTAYFDDIRIQPFDSEMKCYAYYSNNMFLAAELDENNYATFYEYDDAGTLIRVKKETEKGIITIKENRSTYKIQ